MKVKLNEYSETYFFVYKQNIYNYLFDIQVIYRGSVRRLCSCPRCFSVFFSGTLLCLIGKNFWFCIRQKINKILQILVILFTLYFIAPKTLNHLAFQSFEFERTWCMLFQELVVRTNLNIYFFITYLFALVRPIQRSQMASVRL